MGEGLRGVTQYNFLRNQQPLPDGNGVKQMTQTEKNWEILTKDYLHPYLRSTVLIGIVNLVFPVRENKRVHL